MRFFVAPSKEKLQCYTLNEASGTYVVEERTLGFLKATQWQLSYVHLYCFICLALAQVIESVDIHGHYAMFLSVGTIPLYFYIILVTDENLK